MIVFTLNSSFLEIANRVKGETEAPLTETRRTLNALLDSLVRYLSPQRRADHSLDASL